jgi:hypothetical protein
VVHSEGLSDEQNAIQSEVQRKSGVCVGEFSASPPPIAGI